MTDPTELINITKNFGFAAIAFILVYILLKQQQKEMFAQSKETMDFAKTIVTQNTKALSRMYEALGKHMQQKDQWLEKMKECSHNRDERLKEIETTLKNMGF